MNILWCIYQIYMKIIFNPLKNIYRGFLSILFWWNLVIIFMGFWRNLMFSLLINRRRLVFRMNHMMRNSGLRYYFWNLLENDLVLKSKYAYRMYIYALSCQSIPYPDCLIFTCRCHKIRISQEINFCNIILMTYVNSLWNWIISWPKFNSLICRPT